MAVSTVAFSTLYVGLVATTGALGCADECLASYWWLEGAAEASLVALGLVLSYIGWHIDHLLGNKKRPRERESAGPV